MDDDEISSNTDNEDLPPAPGPGATADEWRAWGEAMYKAGKIGPLPASGGSPRQ